MENKTSAWQLIWTHIIVYMRRQIKPLYHQAVCRVCEINYHLPMLSSTNSMKAAIRAAAAHALLNTSKEKNRNVHRLVKAVFRPISNTRIYQLRMCSLAHPHTSIWNCASYYVPYTRLSHYWNVKDIVLWWTLCISLLLNSTVQFTKVCPGETLMIYIVFFSRLKKKSLDQVLVEWKNI